jgi:hypothetical protein
VWQMGFVFLKWSVRGPEWNVPLPNIHLLPPDDGPQTCPKLVEAWLFNKVKINGASCWFIIQIHTLRGRLCDTNIFIQNEGIYKLYYQ